MEYLLVDGYNVINSWPKVFDPRAEPLEDMRDRLVSLLMDYQGYAGCELIVVFDAHHVPHNPGAEIDLGKTKVVFTKENYSADHYIERFVSLHGRDDLVRVVTGDYLEQRVVLNAGGLRVSPEEFYNDVAEMQKTPKKYGAAKPGRGAGKGLNRISESMDRSVFETLQKIRMAD